MALNGPMRRARCRARTSLDGDAMLQDIKVQGQPTGYNWIAPLPSGVTNISTRLYWEPPAP
eukprot:8255601-Pyramimonas_sp.AAC.1